MFKRNKWTKFKPITIYTYGSEDYLYLKVSR